MACYKPVNQIKQAILRLQQTQCEIRKYNFEVRKLLNPELKPEVREAIRNSGRISEDLLKTIDEYLEKTRQRKSRIVEGEMIGKMFMRFLRIQMKFTIFRK
jgi:ribosome biogenesis GTPase A